MAPLDYPLDTINAVTRFHVYSSLRRIARSRIHIGVIEELIQRTDDAIRKSRALISQSDVVSKRVWEMMTREVKGSDSRFGGYAPGGTNSGPG